jgi:protein TonB
LTDDPQLPEVAFGTAYRRIAATSWLTSIVAHSAAMTVLIAAQGWIVVPPQLGSRSGPSSMPSKPSPGDPAAPDSNHPHGEPLVVTITPRAESLPVELMLDSSLAAPAPDAELSRLLATTISSDSLPDAVFSVPPPAIVLATTVKESKAQTPEARPTPPPVEAPPAKTEPVPVGQPAPPTIASLPSDGNGTNSPPEFRRNRPVHYPPEAVRRRIEGTVTLRLQVAADGRVSAVEVASSSGFDMLDQAAADTVRTWRGEPSRVGGQPVAASILLPVEFRLH